MEAIQNIKHYNGNANLKRAGVNVNWTPELVQEWIKCSRDVLYFTRTYIKIVNVDHGRVNFEPFDYQIDMLRAMQDERYCIFACARQSGKSTITCAFILWYVIFHGEKNVALLANKAETAREILGKIRYSYELLPKWLQQGVVEWNKGSIVFENNSKIIATATSSDNIRGFTINLLFIDEAAYIENWDEFFTSVYPTVSSGKSTKVILVSTPNGLNHFYAIWENATKRKNGYKPVLVTWDQVPGRDEEWRQRTLEGMNFDTEKFNQEYCVEFQGSSGTLIAGWKLKELVTQDPMYTDNGLCKYREPEPSRSYVCVVDCSEGKGLDYSAFSVIDVTEMPYHQVCSFRSNQTVPYDYAEIIVRVCRSYNYAAVLVETNNMGGEVANALHYDLEYENILMTENAGRSGKRITAGFSKGVDRGIRTTVTVKAVGCSMLKLLIEQNQLIVNNKDTITELKTFSKKNRSYEAEEGCNDDMVMGMVLFGWLSNQAYFKDLTSINTLANLREKSDEDLVNELTPFGFIEDGTVEEVEIDNNGNRWVMWDDNRQETF